MTISFCFEVFGLVVVREGCGLGSDVLVDGVLLDVVLDASPSTGTGRLPSPESLPPQPASRSAPVSRAAGSARRRTRSILSVGQPVEVELEGFGGADDSVFVGSV